MSKPTILDFKQMKVDGQKISMSTVYDYGMMSQIDKTGIELVLVGDSASMVMMGNEGTIPITMDEMIVFCKSVTKAADNTFVLGDMPFMSYEVSPEKAVENAGRLMKEGGVDGVKLEGGVRMHDTVKKIVNAGIPVLGHIGLTPQSASMLGGFKVQGKDVGVAKEIIKDAKSLEQAGVFGMLIEAVPAELAKLVTENVSVPTIGIGAGLHCDGQVLVLHDMLGLFDKFVPKFAKQYAKLGEQVKNSLDEFVQEVKTKKFPTNEHSFMMKEEDLQNIKQALKEEDLVD